MKIVGIVGRAYYNRDNQKIIQINEDIRRALSCYNDVVCIAILPTNNIYYVDNEMGTDDIEVVDKNKLDCVLDMCDGFIIPGGSSWYNFDEYVIRYAIKKDKPVLAICAGFQAICSMFAVDRNKFDMTKKIGNDSHHGGANEYLHRNRIVSNTKLSNIIGSDIIRVNSVHSDYIDFKMSDLVISSYSEDGIIESVELPNNNYIIGIQWHPEYLMDRDSVKIFDSFIDSMKK